MTKDDIKQINNKDDIKQINNIATEFKMNSQQRKDFGKFLELEKESGFRGTKNARGDFTYQELLEKLHKFLEFDE